MSGSAKAAKKLGVVFGRIESMAEHPVIVELRDPGEIQDALEAREKFADEGIDEFDDDAQKKFVYLAEEWAALIKSWESKPAAFMCVLKEDLSGLAKALKAYPVDKPGKDGVSLLMCAAMLGKIDVIDVLLSAGAKLDWRSSATDNDGHDALMAACSAGQEDAALKLMEAGAPLDRRYFAHASLGKIGNHTLLSIAATRDLVQVVRRLIEAGIPVDVVTDVGYTPLMWALANGASPESARLLLEAGANPEPDVEPVIRQAPRTSPLVLAAQNGAAEIVRLLLNRGVQIDRPDSAGCTALKQAAHVGSVEIVKLLLKAGAEINQADDEGWTPLISASSRAFLGTLPSTRHLEVCEVLLDEGADVTVEADGGTTGLAQLIGARGAMKSSHSMRSNLAALARMLGQEMDMPGLAELESGMEETLRLARKMLERGADQHVIYPGEDKELPEWARDEEDEPLVELLTQFEGGAMTSTQAGSTAEPATDGPEQRLIAAVRNGEIGEVQTLLAEGVDIEATDSGESLLAIAVVMQFALYKKAREVGALDAASYRARARDMRAIIDLLLEAGAKADSTRSRISLVVLACILDDVGLARRLIAAGALVDQPASDSGATALILAAEQGQGQMVRALLDAGADPDLKTSDGKTARDVAKGEAVEWLASPRDQINRVIALGDFDTLRRLAGTREVAALGQSAPLVVACLLGDVEQVRALIQSGIDPNEPCLEILDGATPLLAAIGIARSLETARLLIESGADVNQPWSEDSVVLFEVMDDQFIDLARLLVSKGAKLDVRSPEGHTPLMMAVRKGAGACVDLLLDAGADINATEDENDLGAFGIALNRLDLPLAEHLFKRGAKPEFGSIETLPLAVAEHGSLSLVEGLLASGCELVREDQKGRMAFIAARNPDPEVFDRLLSAGADPLHGNSLGYTPLILAALNDRPTLVRRFLERGADASARDVDGETALSLALEKQHWASLDVLREFHAEERDYPGLDEAQAMRQAALDGALGVILKMRDAGVSLNTADEEGNSPLMLAVKGGHVGVVRSLYHLGGDLNHRNHQGETALSLAKQAEAGDIVNSLQEFGALDALDGPMGRLSGLLGGISVVNAADTMFGRLSHPYKKTPPYEAEEEDDDDDDDDKDEDEDDDSDEAESDESDSDGPDEDSVQAEADEAPSDEEESALIHAVKQADLEAVRRLVGQGAGLHETDSDGSTLLTLAIASGSEELVSGLLELGADPDVSGRSDEVGPLFLAALIGQLPMVRVLLDGDASMDVTCSAQHNGMQVPGCTPLYAAAMAGHLDVCEALLEAGAPIDCANAIGYTPLMAAIEGGHADIVALLLREGASADPEIIDSMGVPGLGGTTPLYSAVMKGDLPIVRQLLECGVDVDRPSAQSWTPLKSAAHQGNEDMVRALLEAGADPNIADDSGYTALMNAVSREHEDIVRLLLEFGADPNVQCGEVPDDEGWIPGRSALMDAVASGNLAITQALLEHDADTELRDGHDTTALSSLNSASPEMVDLLLSAGADLDAFGPPGSAFAVLIHYGESKLDVAQVLLDHGFDPDTVTPGGMSILQIAARLGSLGFAKLLIDAGVDVMFLSGLNCTAFDLAVNYGFAEVAELLRNRMNDVVSEIDLQDVGGNTALMRAVKSNSVSEVKTLLARGADASRRDGQGDTPLSFAVVHGHEEIAAVLRQSGAERLEASAASGTVSIVDAATVGALGSVLDLLDAGADVEEADVNGNTALLAAAHAHPGLLRVLVKKGADLSHRDGSGRTAYQAAAGAGRTLIVNVLTDLGAPVEEVQPDALMQARAKLESVRARSDRSETQGERPSRVSPMLTDGDGDTDLDDETHDPGELLTASFSGNAVAVSRLIAMGADVNQQDEEARTPLALALIGLVQGSTRRRRERDFLQIIDSLLAAGASPSAVPIPSIMLGAMTGRPHIVAALLKAGASLDVTMEVPGENDGNSERANALTLALSSGESGEKSGDRVSLVLVSAGIDLSFREEGGSTVAHLAARNGRVVPLRELLKRNPDLKEATDRQGMTPLMACVEGNQLDCLKVLLDAGADRDARNAEGRTARDLALAVGHGVLADALLVQPA